MNCALEYCCFCSDTLPPDHRYATPPLRCETYDEAMDVIETLKTGDLLLFHTNLAISQAQRCILASYYDHVAVVLKTNVERGKRQEKLPYHLIPAKKCKSSYCACEFMYKEEGDGGERREDYDEDEDEEEDRGQNRARKKRKKGQRKQKEKAKKSKKKGGERKYRLELIEATGKGFHVYPLHQRL